MDKKVAIFVCGVQKGGTTSLFLYFSKHPQLSSPSRKELHFFDNDKAEWDSGPDYTVLDDFFPEDDGVKLRFDITPIYGFWPPAMIRIQAYNPAAKLIFLFRDPFDRAWSHWCMSYARGYEKLTFAQAIRKGRERLSKEPKINRKRRLFSYVGRGLYSDQVRRAMELFPREQLLFLRSSDLLNHHQATLNEIAAFVGIENFPKVGRIREHRRPNIELPAQPTLADRALFTELVREDLTTFAELTGLDVSGWATIKEMTGS